MKPVIYKIYKLTNVFNGKIYIGQTCGSLNSRMGKDGKNYRNSAFIYHAIQKYGTHNFVYSILDETDTLEKANAIEIKYIKQFNSRDPNIGYNIAPGGGSGKQSPQTIQKRITSLMEPQETQNQVIADYQAGLTINKIKEKYSFGGNGKVYRILDKNKIPRLNNFSKWAGKTHSKETKQKMISSALEVWATDDNRTAKMSRGCSLENQADEISQKYLAGQSIASLSEEYNRSTKVIQKLIKTTNTYMKPGPKRD